MDQIIDKKVAALLQKIQPTSDSHKGQNGKVLIIGGSDLFHAASKWSLDVATRLVDMVFFSSTPMNNDLVMRTTEAGAPAVPPENLPADQICFDSSDYLAKANFWGGIVLPRREIENYLQEADAVLIGPGMTRTEFVRKDREELLALPPLQDWAPADLAHTHLLTNYLLAKYPQCRFVLDAGALQLAQPELLTPSMLLTPHFGELVTLLQHLPQPPEIDYATMSVTDLLPHLAQIPSPILLKGPTDLIIEAGQIREQITGGHPGMTKGGTGDCLAGLLVGLYAHSDDTSAVLQLASSVCKKAGEALASQVGPFFNASDLVAQIPKTLFEFAAI